MNALSDETKLKIEKTIKNLKANKMVLIIVITKKTPAIL